MSDESSFGNLGPMFGDLFNMLGQQGADAWFETARALAANVARGSDGDPNPEPLLRQTLEACAPLTIRRLDSLLGTVGPETVAAVRRGELTTQALNQWRPLLAPYANQPAPKLDGLVDAGLGPMFAQLAGAVGPLFMGFQLGSVAGHFSEDAWSLAVLPLPRPDQRQLIVVNNVERFANAWSLPLDRVMSYAVALEHAATIYLTSSGTTLALDALLADAVADAHASHQDLLGQIGSLSAGGDVSELLANPERMLEGVHAPTDTAAIIALDAAVNTFRALFAHLALEVTNALYGPSAQFTEALVRSHQADARGIEAAGALFGVSLSGERASHAARFVTVLAEEHGVGFYDVLLRADGVPSVSELSDPAGWWRRVHASPLA